MSTYFTFYRKRVIPGFIFAPLPLVEEEFISRQHQVVERTWLLLSHDSSSTFPSLRTAYRPIYFKWGVVNTAVVSIRGQKSHKQCHTGGGNVRFTAEGPGPRGRLGPSCRWKMLSGSRSQTLSPNVLIRGELDCDL